MWYFLLVKQLAYRESDIAYCLKDSLVKKHIPQKEYENMYLFSTVLNIIISSLV